MAAAALAVVWQRSWQQARARARARPKVNHTHAHSAFTTFTAAKITHEVHTSHVTLLGLRLRMSRLFTMYMRKCSTASRGAWRAEQAKGG
jgi:hypothetical protein